jgi:hypothetical protein
MPTRVPVPLHLIRQALDSLAYWTPPAPPRRAFGPELTPLDQMYAYWRAV